MSDPDVVISAETAGAHEALRLPDRRALAWSRWLLWTQGADVLATRARHTGVGSKAH